MQIALGDRFRESQYIDENWKSQNATSNFMRMGLRKSPYAFTENGVAELQAEHRKQPKRKPIGFIQPNEDNNDTQK